MPIEAFVLVRTGGEYSDWYHNNLYVFLTREEGDQFIADSNALCARCAPYCFDSDSDQQEAFYEEWDRINGAGPISNEDWTKRYNWAKQKETDRLTDLVLSADCELHEFERIELIKNHFENPHEAFDDAVIEPVEVKEGTRLWRMLTEQQEKEKE